MSFLPFQDSWILGKLAFFAISIEKLYKSFKKLYNISMETTPQIDDEKSDDPLIQKLKCAYDTKPENIDKLGHEIVRLCLLVVVLTVCYILCVRK